MIPIRTQVSTGEPPQAQGTRSIVIALSCSAAGTHFYYPASRPGDEESYPVLLPHRVVPYWTVPSSGTGEIFPGKVSVLAFISIPFFVYLILYIYLSWDIFKGRLQYQVNRMTSSIMCN
jgi:hypothetical protein